MGRFRNGNWSDDSDNDWKGSSWGKHGKDWSDKEGSLSDTKDWSDANGAYCGTKRGGASASSKAHANSAGAVAKNRVDADREEREHAAKKRVLSDKEIDNCKKHNRANKKYLVDEVTYKRRRVLDVSECDEFASKEHAQNEFADIEGVFDRFREEDFDKSSYAAKKRSDFGRARHGTNTGRNCFW